MNRQIILQFDEADYDHVQQAIAKRQSMQMWPDPVSDQRDLGEQREAWNTPDPLADGSNIAGLGIAEICRGWAEMLDMEVLSRPREGQLVALIAAAQCAANVLSLLEPEVKALGHRADNVLPKLQAAIAVAKKGGGA